MKASMKRPITGYRRNVLWLAAMAHRLSGLLLVVFLPLHFWALGLALRQAELDAFLKWTSNPWLKLSEMTLVFLLSVHLLGGLRLLWLENFAWRDNQRQIAMAAGTISVLAALVFLVRAMA